MTTNNINFEEKHEIKEKINTILTKKHNENSLQQLLNNAIEVLNEQKIIIDHKKTIVPDKIIICENKTIVVEYKTGKQNSKYIEQLRDYIHILKELKYKNVEGMLIYLDSSEIFTVNTEDIIIEKI